MAAAARMDVGKTHSGKIIMKMMTPIGDGDVEGSNERGQQVKSFEVALAADTGNRMTMV